MPIEPAAASITPQEHQNAKDIGNLGARVARMEEAIIQIRGDTQDIKTTVQTMHDHNEQVCTLARVFTFFLKFIAIPGIPLGGIVITYLLAKGLI